MNNVSVKDKDLSPKERRLKYALEIDNLLINVCRECPFFTARKGAPCYKDCDTGQQLQKLGEKYAGGKPRKRPKKYKSARYKIPLNEVKHLYYDKGYSARRIGKEYGVSAQIIYNRLKDEE